MEKDNFLEKLGKLVEFAKTRHNALDATEINDFFAGDSLSPEQMDQIYTYLENRNIDVVPILDENALSDDSLLLDDADDSFMKDAEDEELDIDLDAVDLLEGIGTEAVLYYQCPGRCPYTPLPDLKPEPPVPDLPASLHILPLIPKNLRKAKTFHSNAQTASYRKQSEHCG